MAKKLVFIFLTVILAIAGFSHLRRSVMAVNPVSVRSSVQQTLPAVSASVPYPPVYSIQNTDREAGWKTFREKFGKELKSRFGEDGRLLSIVGKLGYGSSASDFSPENEEKVLARAEEILRASGRLLGLRPEWPLGNPMVRRGPISAQVFYAETHKGVPIAPGGGVKIDLGTHGELLALNSDYHDQLLVQNERRLDRVEAQAKALAAFSARNPGVIDPAIEGGRSVVWVLGQNGYLAYDFYVGGRQVIVNAQNGDILASWDRRCH